jgi:hypothetical protein
MHTYNGKTWDELGDAERARFRSLGWGPQGEPTISAVFHFPNGMVAVTDQYGEQMPAYQGRYEDVREAIVAAGFPESRWRR